MPKFHGKNSAAFNYIAEKYQFRFNVVTNFYEFRQSKKGSKWKKYDDRFKNKLLLELMGNSMEIATEKVNIFIESESFSPDYNPFERYFKKLPKHKEDIDYIQLIADTVITENPERFRKTLERFLVGTLDCLLEPDNVNDVCLVFQSKQGIGKTRWMRSLLPTKFQDEYLYEGNIDTRNKDHTQYLSQYWFIHLDELETLKSNEIGAIKSFITRQRISVRKAYGRYKTNFTRRASFLGSVNEDKFLSDITGNRRWLVFKTSKINYEHSIDPDKLWAQVYSLYRSGYKHWFDIDEIKEINNHNERFRTVSQEEEMMLRFFSFPKSKKEKEAMWLSTTEVSEKIIANAPSLASKINPVVVGKALSKHARKKKMVRGIQLYYLGYHGIECETETPSPSANTQHKEITDGDDLPF